MVEITGVQPGSLADKAGIKDADLLVAIGENEINDVLDYRFFLASKNIELRLRRGAEEYKVSISKGEYDDIGLSFERPLMDKKHACENKCVFCFIDQLPRGMRKTLYFKDDDSRLSFLHGNYITLTNLHDRDVERIIKMHISPVNISVHTTDPELRVMMMRNKRAGEVLSYLDRFAEAGISLCTQIVLCRGINDGKALEKTMRDLAKLYPALVSCAVVPAGLTKYRDKLYPLSGFDRTEAGKVIDAVESFAGECLEKYGSRLFFCSDEFYLTAERKLPDEEYYEGYSQLENGVGMLTSLRTEFDFALDDAEELIARFRAERSGKRTVSVATGAAAYDSISDMARRLAERVGEDKLDVKVYKIINRFFGETITVSGLLTGTDMEAQLKGKELGEELFIPANTLKADEDIFLDDKTPKWLSESLRVKVTPSDDSGDGFIHNLLGI